MKKIVKIAAAVLAMGTILGCHAKDECNQPDKNCPQGCVKKAVTPAGEAIWIFAVWDASSQMKDPKAKPCPNTQCWKTADGKVWCAKPVALCPGRKGNCKGGIQDHIRNKARKVMCGMTPGQAVDGKMKTWCVKQVTPCKAKNVKDCKAAEHVKMMDGSRGCAPKADAKAAKEISEKKIPPLANDVIEEDALFLVSAN